MNILFYNHSNGFTGSDISLREIIKYCKQNSHNIFLCLPKSENTSYINSLGIKGSNILFLKPMIWHKNNQKNIFKKYFQIIYIIFKTNGGYFYTVPKLLFFLLKNKIDIVHSNSLVLIDGAIAAKILNIPHVQHIRELLNKKESPFSFPFQHKPQFFKKIMNTLHRKIIFNSNYSKISAINLFPKEKLTVIPNSFPDKLYIERSIKTSVRVIGLVANITSPWKNHILFLKIANLVSHKNLDFKFIIFGKLPNSDSEYYSSLLEFIRINKLENYVSFAGQVTELKNIYGNIDILVHTNNLETFGRIYLESMIFKVPVIAISSNAAIELIENNNNGILINSFDENIFLDKILELKNDEQKYLKLIDEGYRFSLAYKSSLVNKEIIKIYKNLI